ncbi:MAG TPA: hypothetical protein VMZ51_08140 [Acidimicrobiales bacterium]|nr:hypothetical protein [Acidimicrobiales bacterium]
MDDFYCCNGAGSTNNDFLGDTTVHKLLPNADGDTNLWVGSDGNSTSNYLLVDENSPSASDYVESGTLTATDLYNFENLPGGVSGRTVFGVEHWSWAKTTALPNTMAQVTKLSITEVEGPTETMTVTDTWYVHRQETKPGGGAWATSDVDSAQHGSRVKS